jgi:flagellar hook assembly protein FlgD
MSSKYSHRVGVIEAAVTALADDATEVVSIPSTAKVVTVAAVDDSGNAVRLVKAGEVDQGVSAVIDESANTVTFKNELGAALTGVLKVLVIQ